MDPSNYGFAMPAPIQPITGPPPNASYRPMFSEDGTGMPYNSLLSMAGQTVVNQDISYDTSSKDPSMVRARVFIGNIIRGPITRDDLIELCRPQGKLLALTFFKGYAFVQFSEASEADKACVSLNGKRWKGVILDVHLAMTGPGGFAKKKGDASDASRKRRFDEYEGTVMDDTADVNRRNREFSISDTTNNEDLIASGMADTLICGTCRFVTCNLEAFKDHRITGCRYEKDKDEPGALRCASCNIRFRSSWALMCHLTDFHRMMLYKLDDTEEPTSIHQDSVDRMVGSSAISGDGSFNKTVGSVTSLGEDDGPSGSKKPRAPSPNGVGVIGDPIPSLNVPQVVGETKLNAITDAVFSTARPANHPQLSQQTTSWNPMSGPSLTSGVDIGSVYGMR